MFKALFSASHLGIRTAAQLSVVVLAGSVGLSVSASSASSGLDAIANNGSATSITTGTLSLTQAAGPTGTGFTQSLTGLVPGDTRNFYVNVTNGTLQAQDLTLGVTDTASNTLSRNGTPAKGLQVTVTRCSLDWGTVTAGVCSGTSTTLLTTRAITTINTAGTGLVATIFAGAITNGTVFRLKFTLLLPDQDETTTNGNIASPSTSIQNATTAMTWTFRVIQRTVTDTDS
jgi:hypothetical protein